MTSLELGVPVISVENLKSNNALVVIVVIILNFKGLFLSRSQLANVAGVCCCCCCFATKHFFHQKGKLSFMTVLQFKPLR